MSTSLQYILVSHKRVKTTKTKEKKRKRGAIVNKLIKMKWKGTDITVQVFENKRKEKEKNCYL